MKKMILFVFVVISTSYALVAQRARLTEGSLDGLKGVKKMNLQYDYSNMAVGNFATEQEYLDKKKADYNKKEPGKGDAWGKAWVADRKNKFQPQFEELFAKHSDLVLGNFPDSKYTMIFKTVFTEPGFNVYITKRPAIINAEVWIVETADPTKVIAKITLNKCPGRTFGYGDFDTGVRIQESYATAGKALGKFLSGELK